MSPRMAGVSIAILMLAWEATPQGIIVFANTIESRVVDGRTGRPATREDVTVGLYFSGDVEAAVNPSVAVDDLSLVAIADISPLFHLHGVYSGSSVTVPGCCGNLALAQVRAWDAGWESYEEAFLHDAYVGASDLLTIQLLGGLHWTDLSEFGLNGFVTTPVPEPTATVLVLLGVLGMQTRCAIHWRHRFRVRNRTLARLKAKGPCI